MINKQEQNKLIEASYKIIESENLPTPKNIKFRENKKGNKKRLGVCIKSLIDDSYRIIIPLYRKTWIEDEKGRFLNVKTGKKVREGTPRRIDFDEALGTLAHEIAHLRYWNHSTQHYSYTKYIIQRIREAI